MLAGIKTFPYICTVKIIVAVRRDAAIESGYFYADTSAGA
jgi:hypothetical protein